MSEQEAKAFEVLPSKIVQIAADPDPNSPRYDCLALCEDGSVWAGSHKVFPEPETRWFCLSPAHVANRQQASESADETQPALEWHEERIGIAHEMYDRRFEGMSVEVLVCSEGGNVQAARKLGETWISHGGGVVHGVTHWAYMPKGPEVKP